MSDEPQSPSLQGRNAAAWQECANPINLTAQGAHVWQYQPQVCAQQLSSLRLQNYSAQKQPRGRILMTPQRPGFQICGSVPSAIDFCGYIVQDVARIQQDILTQKWTLMSSFLPCPGTDVRIA